MKKINSLITALFLASVINGCNSGFQQPLMQDGFNNIKSLDISKSPDNQNQDGNMNFKMDQFFPAPKPGMKWSYELSIDYGSVVGIGGKVNIKINSVAVTKVVVEVNNEKQIFSRKKFWQEFNLYLIREFHNKTFAKLPGGHFDNEYVIARSCTDHDNGPPTCGGYPVEIPSGKYIVEKLFLFELSGLPDPNRNTFNEETSHYWVNENVGLVEMKLQTNEKPDLGITKLTLIETNIK
jgi:hypothetical protein